MTENEKQDLKVRTKQFALRIIRLYTSLPKTTEAPVMEKQVFAFRNISWSTIS
jgi:hypothetical protein